MKKLEFTVPRNLLGVRSKGTFGNITVRSDGQSIAFSFNSWRHGSSIEVMSRDTLQGSGWNKATALVTVGRRSSGRLRDDEYYDLQLSPDGKYILYNLAENDGESHSIWLVDVATGEQTQLTKSDKNIQKIRPNLSPDGTRIVFEQWDQGITNLCQISVTGKEATLLTHTVLERMNEDENVYLAGNTHPFYSPDGQHIAFLSTDYNGKGGNSPQVCVMRSNGTHIERLTGFPDNCADPTWHPSGTKIAFTTQAELDKGIERKLWKYRTNIHVVNTDGSDLRRLEMSNSFNRIGGFSPDGRYLVYMTSSDERFKEGARNWDIRLLDIATGEIHVITDNDQYNGNPMFSPDGKSILYVSEAEEVCSLYEIEISDANA